MPRCRCCCLSCPAALSVFFFFQAEDGIRDVAVTGVQTCALPIFFQGLEVRPSERPQRVIVRVKLSFEGREAEAEEQGTDTVRNRVEAAARAASSCLDQLMPDKSIALEGATIIDAFDRKFVLVAVHGLGGREAQLLTGTCEIRESAEQSAGVAGLDAANRWTDARR